jgi:hypothetical protein
MRIKTAFLILIPFLLSHSLFSQTITVPDTSWKKGGFVGLNFSQVNLSFWAPGGENSLALSSTVNLFSNYLKDKNDWQNSLDLGYSLIKSGAQKMRKSDDKIDLTSKYGRKFSEHWLYSILLNFKSQFTKGYNYPDDTTVVSKFMAPGYLTAAIGITWKPSEFFEVLISPATAKFTFVTDGALSDLGAYGVDTGETVRSEFGAYLNAKFKKDVMTNVSLTSKLELFNNYTDKDKDNAKQIDVNWETAINMKVNKYITASINTQLVYDANVVERTQFKETIGIGFGYKF